MVLGVELLWGPRWCWTSDALVFSAWSSGSSGFIQERHGDMDHGVSRECKLQKLLALLCVLHTLLTVGEALSRENKVLSVDGVLGRSVELKCGDIDSSFVLIWTFIIIGTDEIVLIARKGNVYEEASALGVVTLTGSSLLIENLKPAAAGRYTCIAFREESYISAPTVSINLTVLVPVTKPNLHIDEQTPVEGSAVVLSCAVEAGTRPLSFIWQRHTILDGTFTVQDGNSSGLILQPATRSHTGWYTCTARNMVNEETSGRLYLDVIYGPDEPEITIKPYAISETGFAANELEEVTLNCSASSNPPCHYIWFYNNSQMSTGQMYVIPKISRTQTGLYTCLAQNAQLNTRTQSTIILTVYYLPEGSPTCTAQPHGNYKDVALWCSWPGGLPLAQVHWVQPNEVNKVIVSNSNTTLVKNGAELRNGSAFTCTISHPSLKKDINCSTTVVMPPGGPNCSAVATKMNEFIMLTCEWSGGLPRITLQWNNHEIGDIKESSNIYVFKPDRTYNGRLFTCTALHPMMAEPAHCLIQLVAPVLDSPNLDTSILEGNNAQLSCHLTLATPSSEITWYDNSNKEIITDSQKYGIYRENGLSALTVRETEWDTDSGLYRCLASNAVGNTSLLLRLRVNKYPTPPNVTISKLLYSRQRTEVDVEWMTQGTGDLTGFMVQRQASIRSVPIPKRSVQAATWDTVANDIEPEIRGHKLGGLDPSIVYAFRILAVNHKTTGFPSEVKTPADPPNNVYPAAIGAGFAGMLVASVASLLVFQYIVRNRENNPRLHDLFFRPATAESRENIRNPEDAETAADGEEGPASAGNAPAAEAPAEASGPSNSEVPLSQMSPTSEEPPVNVTITVTASS
ncbi:V-set and immunoglobulin domain-containing protein 10-like 2 isoform X1 [Ranitomeya variabilis]|uniref:V-set and immunoglobulin domain-containing protein 10-like 2 isoform X1 n=2 Tax=Ranitomeya variabilis TaxID=490064 RepID=UPI0040579467